MYKNALKEDLIRVVEELDDIVESTDTIVKLKTKIENSSTFESDPDFVKTLIQNCIDERVSQNEREETATHIGIREAEDWFRPIDLAKECDIYISSRSGSHKETPITYGYTQDPFKNKSQNFKTKIKENYSQYHERENKNCFICGDSSHCARDCAHAYAYSSVSFPNVSVSNVIENCSYDLPYVKNFNTRNDSSSLIKDYKLLCKKANGAMKTCPVEFISRLPNPLPMKSEHRRFVLLRKIFEPWQWKRRKKRNRFEQTSRTLQRKISMRSTKDQLVEKDVLMPVKHNVFLWNLPDVEEMPSHDGETV
ncbi:phosphatase and actin regulator 2 [Trichonephila clavipes]|nr:phosphatase and actin regulator 2 [Trichonephila clavipes]